MLHRTSFGFAFACHFLVAVFGFSVSQSPPKNVCVNEGKQLWVRHVEPNGVGYNQGYTTLQAFLSSSQTYWNMYPYLDVRGHIFNDGHKGANVGIGTRTEALKRFWGGNVYYDYRGTKRQSWNQLSFGFETIGTWFDVFANGYVVIGQKNSPPFHAKFNHFADHYIYASQKRENAMSGADANVRFHFLKEVDWDCYLDIGPYYYHGSSGKNLFGGKTGLGAILANCFFAEATASYDHTFKWIGQGILGLRLSLGRKDCKNSLQQCNEQSVLAARRTQIPYHNEIIVLRENRSVLPAINPATNSPYFVLFVDNTSSSLGTFESPFPTLLQAETASAPFDLIYVFPGNGTTLGMASGILLKDDQQLLGSGIGHRLATPYGSIFTPPYPGGNPVMTNTGGVGITLANRNTVSGMTISGADSYGIYGNGIQDANIVSNTIIDANQGTHDDHAGIHFEGPGMNGYYLIGDNTVKSTNDHMVGIFVTPNGSDVCSVAMFFNQVNVTVKDGVELKSLGHSQLNSAVSNNSFIVTNAGDNNGFYLTAEDSSSHTYRFQNNICSANGSGHGRALDVETAGTGGARLFGTVIGSEFMNSYYGVVFDGGESGTLSQATVTGNTFSGNTEYNFWAKDETSHTSTRCLSLSNNIAFTSVVQDDYVFENSTTTAKVNVSYFINNIGTFSFGADVTRFPVCPYP